MRIQNTNATFFTLGFHSINLFSSSKDQVLRPISLVLSCKCREFLTLLYIIGKLSNYMLYNYMFSSLEMDPGKSFQPGKKPTTMNQTKPTTTNPLVLSNEFSFVCILYMNKCLLSTFFLLSVLYTNIGE